MAQRTGQGAAISLVKLSRLLSWPPGRMRWAFDSTQAME
jgi:hypothetical protein